MGAFDAGVLILMNKHPRWAIQGTFTTAVVNPVYYGTIYFGF